LASTLGVASEVNDAQVAVKALFAALHNRKRWLLIFDNVEDPDHLAGLLPNDRGHVLVTTRVGNWQEIGSLISVEEFSRAESTALLTAGVSGFSPAGANRVAESLGDLPLALVQAAGTLQSGLPVTEFNRLLDDHATLVLSEN